MPVMTEASMHLAETYWPDDDHWAGHYLVVTGYDDVARQFTVQDTFRGPSMQVDYDKFVEDWQAFNYVYVMIFPTEQRPLVERILGEQWGTIANREHALALAQSEIDADSTDSYAWFNLGTNLVYFEKYSQAAVAYDNARSAGLPQRMLRYQFGPFFAYFHTGRIEDLIALTDYALKITPNSEEAMLWRGWAMYRQGDIAGAESLYLEALVAHPGYVDAEYALNFLRGN
jgi:tetratricopeptide (TPR) repeat protein